MKKLIALMLVLAMCLTFAACGCKHEWYAATCDAPKTCSLCGETEGEANGHSIVAATCEEAEHCENCDYVNGEALGHTWVDATTEAPKTCQTCGATEGERIITDPRFTTAATKDLYGTWELEMELTGDMMGIPDFPAGATIRLQLIFSNAGDIDISAGVGSVYAEFEAQGMDRETANAAFAEVYDMSIEEYVDEELAAIDLNEMFTAMFGAINMGGVYYVEDGVLYAGDDWEDDMEGESFTLDGDSLILESITEEFGTQKAFIRVTE